MFTHLDHLIVAVDDLKAAAENYQKLFGMSQFGVENTKSLEPATHYLLSTILILKFYRQQVRV